MDSQHCNHCGGRRTIKRYLLTQNAPITVACPWCAAAKTGKDRE